MRLLRQFLKNEHGVAMLEFILVFPFLFTLIFGLWEMTRLLYIQQKVEKAGYVIGDVVTRYVPAARPVASNQISLAEIQNNVMPILGRIMGQYQDASKQAVIITSFNCAAASGPNCASPVQQWQVASPGTGGSSNSLTGCVDAVCVNSTAMTGLPAMRPGETMVVTEVFYRYDPILQSALTGITTSMGQPFFLKSRIFVKRTYLVPRNGTFDYLPPLVPVP